MTNGQLKGRLFSRCLKIQSALTAILFLFNALLVDTLGFANAVATGVYQDAIDLSQESKVLSIPAEIGSLQDFFSPVNQSNNTFIIHIQDAHANADAQLNIREILGHLSADHEGEAFQVAVEGASGNIHPEYLNLFPEYPAVNEAVVEHLLKSGELTGAELFAWNQYQESGFKTVDESAFHVVGVENESLYRENLKNYRELLIEQESIAQIIRMFKTQLDVAASRVFTPELRKFMRERDRRKHGNYDEGHFNGNSIHSPQLSAYLSYLAEQAERKLGIYFTERFEQVRFPNLYRLYILEKISKSINRDTANKEHRVLLKELSSRMNDTEKFEILSRFERIAEDRESRFVLETVWQKIRDYRIAGGQYRDFWMWMAEIVTRSEINSQELFKEMDLLESWLVETMVTGEKDRALVELMQQFLLVEKLLSLKLTRNEYHELLPQQENIYQTLTGNEISSYINGNEKPVLSGDDLSDFGLYFNQALDFYQGAEERDDTLLSKTVDLAEESTPTILITGGFHTFGFTERLREQNIGYAVIQPKIRNHDHGELYHRVLREENADVSAYFTQPYLTKQEAVYLKAILEVAIPRLWQDYEIPHSEIGKIVMDAINEHPVLAGRVHAEVVEENAGSVLQLQLVSRTTEETGQAATVILQNAVGITLNTSSPQSFSNLYAPLDPDVTDTQASLSDDAVQIQIRPTVGTVVTVSKPTRVDLAPATVRSETRELEAYRSKDEFIRYMVEVRMPEFMQAYPQAPALYAQYRDAFTAGDDVLAKKLAAQIEALVDEFNAVKTAGRFQDHLGEMNLSELTQAPVAQARTDYDEATVSRAEDMILNGEEAPEDMAAGAATRLGLGNMFSLSLNEFRNALSNPAVNIDGLDDATRQTILAQVDAAIAAHPEYASMPMGARLMLQRRADIERILRKRNPNADEATLQQLIQESMSKQKVSLLVNAEVVGDVVAFLQANEFFGYSRANVYLTVQPTFKGYGFTNGQAYYNDQGSKEIVNGHGYPTMQKFFPGQAFTIAEDGTYQYLDRPLVDELWDKGVRVLSINRINDMTRYEYSNNDVDGNATDIPGLIASVEVLGGFDQLEDSSVGADQAIELVDNPTKQKGGLFPTTPKLAAEGLGFMPDTLAAKDQEWLDTISRIESEIGDGMPYNAMRQRYKLASLREKGKIKGVNAYLRFRAFDDNQPMLFAAETVTGDTTFFLQSAGISMPEREIRDFKKASNMPALIEIFSKQNELFRQLGIAPVRSESRDISDDEIINWLTENTPELADYTVVSRQFELGIDPELLEQLERKFANDIPGFVAQLTLTGGLGALMPDLTDGYKKNGTNIINLNPLYNDNIKGLVEGLPEEVKTGQKKLGDYLRAVLTDTGIEFKIKLPVGDDFRAKARGKARQIVDRELTVKVYQAKTKHSGLTNYYLDVFYTNRQGQVMRVFDEVYPDSDESGTTLWRDVHMGVFSLAGQRLIQELQKRDLAKQKLVFVDNEVFASMPTALFPDAVHHHINHTVFRPGLYRPDVSSYEMLGFPQWMRPLIVRDGKINVTDAVAMFADIVTGVGLYEHTPVLRDQGIFSAHLHKLQGYNQDGVRSTNGVLLDRWQSEAIRKLISDSKRAIGLSENVDDEVFFEQLKNKPKEQQRFQKWLEIIKAAHVAVFLDWMATEQQNDRWLTAVIRKYEEQTSETVTDPAQFVREFVSRSFYTELDMGRNDEILKNLLLENPIVSNIRRQVPYKGPEKWVELLESLKRDPAQLENFRNNASRVVIGGRIFDQGAKATFERIKQLVRELGLEDNIATIENYNSYIAPVIFQAMAGTVMLSDEFLEASATSMMKGVTNGAVLIGVWGGAMPELFTIIDKTQDNRIVDIFAENVTHDQLVQKLKSGEWEIPNGFLVQYSDDEYSQQEGGGRRPLAASLGQALFDLKKSYQTSQTRQKTIFDVVSSSPKVDIEKNQARAHMFLWQGAIQEKARLETLFNGLSIPPDVAVRLLDPKEDDGFGWTRKIDPDQPATLLVEKSGPGVLGFLDGFRRLRMHGLEALWSIQYHANNITEEAPQGDIFFYLKNVLFNVQAPSVKPVKDEIDRLAKLAEQSDDDIELASYNLLAYEIVDRLATQLTFELLKSYAAGNKTVEPYFQDAEVRKNLVRFLDREASPLALTSTGIKSYSLKLQGELVQVHIDTDDELPAELGVKAWGTVYTPESMETILGTEAMSHLTRQYQVQDVITGEDYGEYSVGDLLRRGLSVGVPAQTKVQLTRFIRPQEDTVVEYLVAAIREEFVEGKIPAELLIDLIKQLRENPNQLKSVFEGVARQFSAEEAKARFSTAQGSTAAIPGIMALISVLTPDLLRYTRDWDRQNYTQLDEVINGEELQSLFDNGEVNFLPTNRRTAIVFSKSIDDRHIVVPIYLGNTPYIPNTQRVSVRVRSLDVIDVPNDATRYRVYNHTEKRFYPDSLSGAALHQHGWGLEIPVFDGAHYQVLELVPESEVSNRSESRIFTVSQESLQNFGDQSIKYLFENQIQLRSILGNLHDHEIKVRQQPNSGVISVVFDVDDATPTETLINHLTRNNIVKASDVYEIIVGPKSTRFEDRSESRDNVDSFEPGGLSNILFIAPDRSTSAVQDAAVAYLQENPVSDQLSSARVEVSENLEKLYPSPQALAAEQDIPLDQAIALVLTLLLDEADLARLNGDAMREITNFLADSGIVVDEATQPIHLMPVVNAEELQGDRLTSNLFALAALIISRPKDLYTLFVPVTGTEEQPLDIQGIKDQFAETLKGLKSASQSRLERLNIVLVTRDQLRSEIVKQASDKRIERTAGVIAADQSFLESLGVIPNLGRFLREGLSVDASIFWTGTALREQLSDDYEVINLAKRLSDLGITEEAAQRIAVMVASLKRLSASA